MSTHQQGAHAVEDQQREGTPEEKHRRKQRVTNKDRSALVRSIADAVVIKDEDLFFLSERDGRVPLNATHGFGLYYHDCRFLNGYELHLADSRPSTLVATAPSGFKAELVVTNPDIRLSDGSLLQKEDLGIRWERVLDASRTALGDRITFRNYRPEPATLPVSLRFGAAFEDIFTVRGMPTGKRGRLHPPAWKDGVLSFAYDGTDGLHRTLDIHFSPAAQRTEGTTAHFELTLQPQQSVAIQVTLQLAESPQAGKAGAADRPLPDLGQVTASLERSAKEWLDRQTEVRAESILLGRVLERSLRDLRVLRSSLRGHTYFAAGVPWYVTLFGRDSLISSLQSLAYEPEVAEHTLRLLAAYQGQKVDEWRDEEPGKIMHELRVGELARTNEVPQTPYYGTIDATPLFLILLSRHAAWTGRLDLFHDLRGHVEAALGWMAKYGDPKGEGYLAYQVKSKKGLGNQGWKDSGDAIVNADGSLARPPVALAEVQGYAYLAKVGLAGLYRRAGDPGRADQLRREAEELRRRFNRDYWLEDEGVYALALQDGKEPAAVVSSNAGQVLWSGIADPDKARRTVERLMADDMFSGWGVRTLATGERRYNPLGYHLGTVWPHDNALIAAGCRRYGLDEPAGRIFGGILDAAMHFPHRRLPELFAGFARAEYQVPVHYPVACHPQAWAAGAVPYLLETALGLRPAAFERRLLIARPMLPPFTDWVEVRGLRVGRARADLRFERSASGRVAAHVLAVDGDLDVVMELQAPPTRAGRRGERP